MLSQVQLFDAILEEPSMRIQSFSRAVQQVWHHLEASYKFRICFRHTQNLPLNKIPSDLYIY